MTSEQPPAERDAIAVTEADVDEVLSMCSGDPRAAIKALLIGQQYLEMLLEEARRKASRGYVRARRAREADHAAEG